MLGRLESLSCTVVAKVGEEGQLYASVGAQEIVEALKTDEVELHPHALRLEKPIKELGVFEVPVRLHPEVEGVLKVWVVEG